MRNFCTLCGVLTHGVKACTLTEHTKYQISPTIFAPIFSEWIRASFDTPFPIAYHSSSQMLSVNLPSNQLKITYAAPQLQNENVALQSIYWE